MISQATINKLNELSSENVAEKLGINVVRHRALCFMHDDHHPSLHFSGENREWWWCFVCNKGGRALNLVMEYTDMNLVDACHWLGQEFGITIEGGAYKKKCFKPNQNKTRIYTEEEKPFSVSVAQWILDNNSLGEQGKMFLYGKRKLSANVIKKLHIVSIEDSSSLVEKMSRAFDQQTLLNSGFIKSTNDKLYFRMFTPSLIFPYYDTKGTLVGLQSRYLGTNEEAPRFQFVSSLRTRLFNLPILNELNYGNELYISEGITDCLALLSQGFKAVAIPSATILPKTDLIRLCDFNLCMYPDQDETGENAYRTLRSFFIIHNRFLKRMSIPEGMKDFSEYYLSQYGK